MTVQPRASFLRISGIIAGCIVLVTAINFWALHHAEDLVRGVSRGPDAAVITEAADNRRGVPVIDPANDPLAPVNRNGVSPSALTHVPPSADHPEEAPAYGVSQKGDILAQ